jgi:hypothetical protein
MKIKLTILFVFGFLANAFSQEGLSLHLKGIEGCYLDYYAAFANRGAKPVTDGDHEVVISIIFQDKSDCYMGKVTVKEGKFITPVLIQKEDMSFAPLSTIFKNLNQVWLAQQDRETLNEINDGMSKMFISEQGYMVQLFFPGFINATSGVNRKAPPASELLKKDN